MEQPISVTTDKPFLVVHIGDRRWYYEMKRWDEKRAIAHVKQSLLEEEKPPPKKIKQKQIEAEQTANTGMFN